LSGSRHEALEKQVYSRYPQRISQWIARAIGIALHLFVGAQEVQRRQQIVFATRLIGFDIRKYRD
jgi:hypothetical protein